MAFKLVRRARPGRTTREACCNLPCSRYVLKRLCVRFSSHSVIATAYLSRFFSRRRTVCASRSQRKPKYGTSGPKGTDFESSQQILRRWESSSMSASAYVKPSSSALREKRSARSRKMALQSLSKDSGEPSGRAFPLNHKRLPSCGRPPCWVISSFHCALRELVPGDSEKDVVVGLLGKWADAIAPENIRARIGDRAIQATARIKSRCYAWIFENRK